jgi:hypothetical protein
VNYHYSDLTSTTFLPSKKQLTRRKFKQILSPSFIHGRRPKNSMFRMLNFLLLVVYIATVAAANQRDRPYYEEKFYNWLSFFKLAPPTGTRRKIRYRKLLSTVTA